MIERLVEFKRQRKLYAWKNERSVTFRAATPFQNQSVDLTIHPYVTVEKVNANISMTL